MVLKHAIHVEIFNHDRGVIRRNKVRHLVQCVISNVGNPTVQSCDDLAEFCAVASFGFGARHLALQPLELLQVLAQRLGCFENMPVRQRHHLLDSKINPDTAVVLSRCQML